MKILDRYIAKHFLIGFLIAFTILVGLRIVIDLFVNLDEFTENMNLGIGTVLVHTLRYYAINTTLYFREFSGMITVVAAAFSLGKLVRTNELIAIMASGVSLKRVVAPILVIALLLTGLGVVNQEILIPYFSPMLVQHKDQIDPNDVIYMVWFLVDRNNALICADHFAVGTASFQDISIIQREKTNRPGVFTVTGRISADQAHYNASTGQWDLTNGQYMSADVSAGLGIQKRDTYEAPGLHPHDIPVLLKAEDKSLLSFRQLATLGAHSPRDIAQLYSQKHFRVTEPIINLVTLLVCLPVLLVRDPRAMKTAILTSFALTALCTMVTFTAKMLATEEVFFKGIIPEFWAWLPIFIFVPIAFIELDTMKT